MGDKIVVGMGKYRGDVRLMVLCCGGDVVMNMKWWICGGMYKVMGSIGC